SAATACAGATPCGSTPRQGAGSSSRKVARFSSTASIAGSMRLAIQPARRQPSARIASAPSRLWLRQPSRRPTTKITGNSHAFAMSAANSPGASGTRQPPTPSTTTASCSAHSASNAARKGGKAIVTPSCAAARCGDKGSRNATGLLRGYGGSGALLAARSASASSFCRPCVVSMQPLATGFMPVLRRPAARSACSKVQLAWVLPMPVSVPATKYVRVIGSGYRAHPVPPPEARGQRPDQEHQEVQPTGQRPQQRRCRKRQQQREQRRQQTKHGGHHPANLPQLCRQGRSAVAPCAPG